MPDTSAGASPPGPSLTTWVTSRGRHHADRDCRGLAQTTGSVTRHDWDSVEALLTALYAPDQLTRARAGALCAGCLVDVILDTVPPGLPTDAYALVELRVDPVEPRLRGATTVRRDRLTRLAGRYSWPVFSHQGLLVACGHIRPLLPGLLSDVGLFTSLFPTRGDEITCRLWLDARERVFPWRPVTDRRPPPDPPSDDELLAMWERSRIAAAGIQSPPP